MGIEGLSFEGMNESDVREEFVAPLLRLLGYQSGTQHHIIREQSLRYPKEFLGRKKASDPLLRGKADYICEVGRRIRWVIEAKAPSEELGLDEAEQAYTYARHPEVRAVYFCLTNGHRFLIYRTDQSPDSDPVLAVDYVELPAAFSRIESVLSPAAIERDHPVTRVNAGPPVGPGLRSLAQIVSGRVTIHTSVPSLPPLLGLNHSITTGAIEHAPDGSLVAFLELLAPFQSLQDFSRRFGLDRLELTSEASTISSNATEPTVFHASREIIIPEGERVFDMQAWSYVVNPITLVARTVTLAEVSVEQHRLYGSWSQTTTFATVDMEIKVLGDFEAQVF